MAEYLNEVTMSNGKKIYTAARDDGTGNVITDTQLFAVDENGNKVPVKVSADGEVLTRVTGSYVEYRILKDDPMPTLKPEEKGALCIIIDGDAIYMSTGTEWEVF